MMEFERKKKLWRLMSLISGLMLVAAFILLFYSLSSIYSCAGASFSEGQPMRGLCSEAGLKAAANYNRALMALIGVCTAGIVVGLIKADRAEKQALKAQEAEEDEEPATEGMADQTDLPAVHPDRKPDDKQG